jgi:hypothetical protein
MALCELHCSGRAPEAESCFPTPESCFPTVESCFSTTESCLTGAESCSSAFYSLAELSVTASVSMARTSAITRLVASMRVVGGAA